MRLPGGGRPPLIKRSSKHPLDYKRYTTATYTLFSFYVDLNGNFYTDPNGNFYVAV